MRIILPVLLTLVLAGPGSSRLSGQSRAALVGGPILGGYVGAVTGTFVGAALCPSDRRCAAPSVFGLIIGAATGLYLGHEQEQRVEGAAIAAGIGALAGVAVVELLVAVRRPGEEEGARVDAGVAGFLLGSALGAMIGAVASGGKDDPIRPQTVRWSFPLTVRF